MITPVKRILSWFVPLTLKVYSSETNPSLKVKLYRGELLLTTTFAIYSQGKSYRPFRKMFQQIKTELQQVQSFLLLGTGLGSALKILQDSYQCYPRATLVDLDPVVLEISKEWMNLNTKNNVQWYCEEAKHFLQNHSSSFDLIGLDVFHDLTVPLEIRSIDFMRLCEQRLNQHGILCWNMIHPTETDEKQFEDCLHQVFQVNRYLLERNFFYICRRK